MIDYRQKNADHDRYCCNPGERYKQEYTLKISKDGQEKLEPNGKTDVQALIDSYEPSVNLNNILERFKNGETDVLEKAKGWYADISELPVSLQDIMNLNKKGKEFFESLPTDVKEAMNSNYMEFLFEPGKLLSVLEAKNKEENDLVIEKNIEETNVKSSDVKEVVSNGE